MLHSNHVLTTILNGLVYKSIQQLNLETLSTWKMYEWKLTLTYAFPDIKTSLPIQVAHGFLILHSTTLNSEETVPHDYKEH